MQDEIIRSMLSFEDMQRGQPTRSSPEWQRKLRGGSKAVQRPQNERPWCIFTAGCMGSGKTHVMCTLDAHGLLPLPRFVRVDIDRIRMLLPELDGYVRHDRMTAGEMTQKEAGAIAEIATEEALMRGYNVWVDSTMKNEEWWSEEIGRIQKTFPHRTCILHVTARWPAVQQREARRGEVTGRRIPPRILEDVFRCRMTYAQACMHASLKNP